MTIRKNQEKIDKVNFEIFPVYIADVLKKCIKCRRKAWKIIPFPPYTRLT